MRRSRAALLLAIALVLAVAGCTTKVAGTATRDPAQPPLTLSKDGYGIVAGFDDAPTRIEIFTEPQCGHCADLQKDFADQFAYYIGVGALKITYRPLTFLDDAPGGYSAHVSNALFLAADGGAATGTQFQRFVKELYAHQQRTKGGAGPSDDEIAEMAKTAGMPDEIVDRIADGGSAVDVADMDTNNFEYLYEIDNLTTGTPTVYDPENDEKLDIYDNNWLTKLMQT
ncbi:protein-disulfide isomerase [Mycolicibacterium moriokaense]|uniref:Protein disulfide-isomerase n=1 Tax=Mycolicibacterium moriokaense TaxID=39691 RepID=A0AAD1HIC0_9MYCO|nr:thioredoxin domain-containing protein [Mycolicibacterium moriokaense]MCV7041993.1 DsbA family protein [Mycolicibacterium moriokaense]ORB25078.1 protein-disulfide isomerase [Mycolicibacterium moriokaense]BBX04761.1 protein disulfide-isomerase [Mycolicibacterium moriokaense]